MSRVMPPQKPGSSKQDVETPAELLQAIEARWGKLTLDLAAREDNKKTPVCFTPEQNSLIQHWHHHRGLCWLNPPFSNIRPWAAKCEREGLAGARIIMLTPASVSTEWYAAHVHQSARVVFLRPRVKFVGHKQGFPKDMMLTLWGPGFQPGYESWKWLP
jgi:phage N-6-adenine-methyltransferase